MATPPYVDLGKLARDVFNRGYHFGQYKLDVKTKTESGIQFLSGFMSTQETGRVHGTLETKYKINDWGLSLSERWNTDNVMTTEVTISDKPTGGAKITAIGIFAPHTGSKSGILKTVYQHENFAFNFDADFKTGGPFLTASLVLGYQGFVAGYQGKFDCQNTSMTSNSAALGYIHPDFVVHACTDNAQNFSGSIYHKVTKTLDAGFEMNWTNEPRETKMAVGCKLQLDDGASVKAKVNLLGQIGLAYSQKLRDGISISFAALLEGKNFNQGGHRLGIGLEMEA